MQRVCFAAGMEGGAEAGHDALSAIAGTSRLTGTGRLNTILDLMACWRMKFLHGLVRKRERRRQRPFRSGLMICERNWRYVPEDMCIGCQACDSDANVGGDAEHLLLVRRQLAARALKNVGVA